MLLPEWKPFWRRLISLYIDRKDKEGMEMPFSYIVFYQLYYFAGKEWFFDEKITVYL